MQQYRYILVYGFAIFAMFFGSGNLVFPIQIGYAAGDNWLFGFLGLFLTGIILPFLGLFVIKFYKGDYNRFFGEAGVIARLILPLFILSLLGSFAVIPRCITVAHGGINYIFPELSLVEFSVFFSLITYFFCLKEQLMVNILGKWMSPVLLVVLLFLIGVGILYAPNITHSMSIEESFTGGFLTGYQTMDLFAAFFFSTLVYKQMEHILPANASDREILKFLIKPSIIGSLLLGVIYLGLVFLGAHYREIINPAQPQLMLPTISNYVLGGYSTLFIAIAMVFSCFTTAVALNNIYASYLCKLCRFKESKYPLMLIATTLVSFIVSLLDFKGIAAFLAPVLEASYPGLIALTVMSIFTKNYKKTKFMIFWGVTIYMIIFLVI